MGSGGVSSFREEAKAERLKTLNGASKGRSPANDSAFFVRKTRLRVVFLRYLPIFMPLAGKNGVKRDKNYP
jgi:hypothetical protein